MLDRGPGIAHDQLEAVVQPFYRGDASGHRRTGGSGLGLAVAKQLALAMNATLGLNSHAGGGLEARLVLEKPFQKRLSCGRVEP